MRQTPGSDVTIRREWRWLDVVSGQTSQQPLLVERAVIDHRLQTDD
jgi:hypothetical protein